MYEIMWKRYGLGRGYAYLLASFYGGDSRLLEFGVGTVASKRSGKR